MYLIILFKILIWVYDNIQDLKIRKYRSTKRTRCKQVSNKNINIHASNKKIGKLDALE